MNAPSSFAFVAEFGAGNPDQRTARNVLELIVPAARKWAASADENAMIDAAETQARRTLDEVAA